MTGETPICDKCKNFQPEKRGLVCKAFPKGIPEDIILDGNLHKKPLENQGNDVVFEERE